MKKGFSFFEVILAIGIFSLVASFFILLIIESYRINEKTKDMSLATFLAQEGIEAVRSIRDSNFSELVPQARSQCLAIENNRWVLKRIPNKDCIENIDNKFFRQIYIISVGTEKVKVISLVSWQPKIGPKREVRLFSRVTNWVK
ncbi:MAG: hypothetical protein ACK413_01695 [Patescibacteria group bacterium]